MIYVVFVTAGPYRNAIKINAQAMEMHEGLHVPWLYFILRVSIGGAALILCTSVV